MEIGVQYRRGMAADVPTMYALDVICFEEPFRFSQRAMRRFALGSKARVWVAEEAAGELVGFVIVEVEGDAGYVVTLDVAPEWRRGGVARELMGLAGDAGEDAGAACVCGKCGERFGSMRAWALGWWGWSVGFMGLGWMGWFMSERWRDLNRMSPQYTRTVANASAGRSEGGVSLYFRCRRQRRLLLGRGTCVCKEGDYR